MAKQPKFIDKSLITPPEKTPEKKVNKKPYSFRCDETLLAAITKYSEIAEIPLPQLLSEIISEFLEGKTLTNDFIYDYTGSYINIRSHDGQKNFEYELLYLPNNLDVWDDGYRSINNAFIHEGIDFVIIPETVHTHKIPDHEMPTRDMKYYVDLNKIPDCLYCMHIFIDPSGTVGFHVVSFMDAVNKLKKAGRVDLINYGHDIKKKLDQLHQEYITEVGYYDDMDFDRSIYRKLLYLRNKYNSGAIRDAESGLDSINEEYILRKLPDTSKFIKQLLDKNKELSDRMSKVEEIISDSIEIIEKVKLTDEDVIEKVKIDDVKPEDEKPVDNDGPIDDDADQDKK